MSPDQRKAARSVMARYPLLKVDVGPAESSLTPYLQAKPDNRGETVTVNDAKTPSTLSRELEISCRGVS